MDTYSCPDPLLVAPGSFLVRHLRHRSGRPLDHPVNSLVVLGAQPVLVDTGSAGTRQDWIEQTFGLVEPEDVRWIVVTHHDADHVGNLDEAIARCTGATIVLTAYTREHLDVDLPAGRVREVTDGDVLHLPDRDLVAVRPPVFDSPGTLGVFDTSTRLYWACEAFSAPVPGPVDDVDATGGEGWSRLEDGCRELAPWSRIVDPARFDEWVERVVALDPTVVTSAHGPVVRGDSVRRALDCLRHS